MKGQGLLSNPGTGVDSEEPHLRPGLFLKALWCSRPKTKGVRASARPGSCRGGSARQGWKAAEGARKGGAQFLLLQDWIVFGSNGLSETKTLNPWLTVL